MVFIPLRDDNRIYITPWITIIVTVVNVLIGVFIAILPDAGQAAFFRDFGTVSAQLLGYEEPTGPAEKLTLLTSSFLHADIPHLVGNMILFLIFADNVEYAFGNLRYILFLLAAAAGTAAAQAFLTPDLGIPCIGASGIVAAVLGAYSSLYPGVRVSVMAVGEPLLIRAGLAFDFAVPAWLLIGMWFAMDVYYFATSQMTEAGGIAYAAHVAGFVGGFAVARLLRVNYTKGEIEGLRREHHYERFRARRSMQKDNRDD